MCFCSSVASDHVGTHALYAQSNYPSLTFHQNVFYFMFEVIMIITITGQINWLKFNVNN